MICFKVSVYAMSNTNKALLNFKFIQCHESEIVFFAKEFLSRIVSYVDSVEQCWFEIEVDLK